MSVQSMDKVTEMDSDTMFTCPLCNEEFYPEEEHLLREHMKAAHLEQMLAYHRQPNKTKPKKITLCFALGCNETTENKNLSFFYLPRRPRGLVWIINAGRYDMLSTPVELYVHNKICSKHFEMSVCADTLKSKIFTNALPTIFTHSLEIITGCPTSEGAKVPAKSIEPRYSNSLTDQFRDTVIFERGSQTKMFSITVAPVKEYHDLREIKSRPATKVFKAENKVLIYKLLQGQDVYRISESIFKNQFKGKHNTSASKIGNASADREVSKSNQRMSEFFENNYGHENYHIFSLEDIDPLLHQDNCSSVIQLTEEIVNNNNNNNNNNKETGLPEITFDTVLYDQTSMPEIEVIDISEDVGLVKESFLEHDYCSVRLCSISSLCRLCAKELQNPDEKSVFDVLQSLHPLFQKCLDLSQDFNKIDCLPKKMCSSCVEKLQMCNPLFQQIAETNVKLKTYLSWTQKDAGLNNTSGVGKFEVDEQLKEDQHTSLFGTEVTNGSVKLEEPSEEPCESYVCDECPESRVYETLIELRCHKALVHEVDNDTRGKANACKYCRRKFGSLKDFYHHPCKRMKRPNRPEHPPVQRILKTVYTRRYKRHADGYVCCTCGHVAPSEDDIKTHWRSHIPSLPPRKRRQYPKKEPIYGCHICGRRFSVQKYLAKHIEMHPNWRCKTCGKLFKSHILLKTHKRKHEPDFVRLCHLCGKLYANIFQHMKNVHSTKSKPTRTVICHICGKVVPHSCLKRHIYTAHERVNKNIPCPHCQKTYIDEFLLKKHIYKVHATPRPFKCELCNMAYKMPASLRKHVDKQHPACKMCQKRFPTMDAKSKHEVLEHYEGSGCEQSFDTEDSMQENRELEETVYSLEDLQAISANVQVILATGDELLPRNW